MPVSIDAALEHHKHGRYPEAKLAYEAILKAQPAHATAMHYLGMIAFEHQQYERAQELIEQSISIHGPSAVYLCNLGLVLRRMGKVGESVEALNKSLALKPDYDEAFLNLSAAYFDLGKFAESAACAERVIELNPGSVKAYDNLGTALRSLKDFSGSIESYQRAIQLDPNYVAAYSNIAATYFELKDLNAMCAYCLAAIKLDPNHANAYLYLGIALQHKGDWEGAEKIMLRAVALAPKNFLAHWNMSLLMLAMGKLRVGWESYESRWHLETNPVVAQSFPYPWWLGESMPDKTILIWGEQGIGDQIMFANMVDDVIARFKSCVIACPRKLAALFARSFPRAHIVCQDDRQELARLAPQIDVQSAVGSLARWLRPTIESFPKKDQYLFPAAERVAYWKERLAGIGPELKVGICWRSSNVAGGRQLYCTDILQWAPILSIPGIQFINFQYDDCLAELEKAKEHLGITVHRFAEVDMFDDLDETAALTKAVDLVVGIPTTSLILAASLGVPAWMLSSGFTWQKFGTDEMGWYTTARLFERPWDQPWETMLAHVSELLRIEVQRHQLKIGVRTA